MQLSKRLQCVVAQVENASVVADIGCDHGFTSIALVEQARTERVIAMDINRGPLLRAQEHIQEAGLQNRIETRLSDGTEKLVAGEADVLLISGMGGALICHILQSHPEVVRQARELVLSPQSEIHLVRRLLHEIGYEIQSEEMLMDQGKYYVILHAVHGEQQYIREEEYLYGGYLIERKSAVLQEYLHRELVRVRGIIQSLSESTLSPAAEQKKLELEQQKQQMEWTLQQMQVVDQNGDFYEKC